MCSWDDGSCLLAIRDVTKYEDARTKFDVGQVESGGVTTRSMGEDVYVINLIRRQLSVVDGFQQLLRALVFRVPARGRAGDSCCL